MQQGLYDPRFERDACGVGFIADVEGRASHATVRDALQILVNLTHRGAAGSDPDCGDGAGILMQLPDKFLRARCADAGIALPGIGRYGAGMVFLPPGRDGGACMEALERCAAREGLRVLGWRDVPHDRDAVGGAARASCPDIKQLFVADGAGGQDAFERALYVARRCAEKEIAAGGLARKDLFYVASLSSRTITYKGMFMARQVTRFYADLACDDMETAIAVVHQRYSTNTFPSWPLAHPFRVMCHNGEINTLRGNLNKMSVRGPAMDPGVWGERLARILPVIQNETGSDSACFDNVLELLILSGRSPAASILMMIPEAWGGKYYMGHDRRGFYEYHANFIEPWDGPAAIAFSDGVQVGGILDRNGLRPARYTVTRDGRVILASEAGVLDIPAEDIASRGRLQPGKLFLVDTARRHILHDDEIKADICRRQPYRRWVAANRIEFQGFGGMGAVDYEPRTIVERQLAFGYTREDLEATMRPMIETETEPIGSMGNDTPLAVLSDRPQLLFNYFRQNFAQVTNPPIDPIRERLVMSLTTFLGREGDLLSERPEHAHRLKLLSPIITNADLERIRTSQRPEFRAVTLDITFAAKGDDDLGGAVESLCREAEAHVRDGATVLILSDRHTSPARVAVPSLLAVSAVGAHLTRLGLRNRAGLVLESGEPREVNHAALLLAYGVEAINPYLAIESVAMMHAEGMIEGGLTLHDAVERYMGAIDKGILKILSKMGISTLRSYRGAQVYEALGLSRDLVEKHFPRTVSRLGGIGLPQIEQEARMRHHAAFGPSRGVERALPHGGHYSFRRDGERRLWSPEAIHWLQHACRAGDAASYRKFADSINSQAPAFVTLRSLLDFAPCEGGPVPLDEVEPAGAIIARFVTGAMSFGSLSREAHETIAVAMNRLGAASNSGEGGEDAARYVRDPNGDSRSSAVKQVASGRFGVTIEYLASARELQIKIAQGAKPGEGGHLPGHKVDKEIARVRNSTPGVSLISPPPHHDIYSIEDLAQLIYDLKCANPDARISVKLVAESGVGTVAAGVAKGKADMVLISGGDGGTGASPLSSIKHAGIPWELGLAETHQTLVRNDLRGRIRIQTDGQMRTGRDVAVAALLGAEEFGFGTAPLVVLGCVMMRKCHANTCPVGVATQDPRLRARFQGKPEHLVSYFTFVAEELRAIMATLGFRKVEDMVGRADRLKLRDGVAHWKASLLDLDGILHRAEAPAGVATRCVQAQDHGTEDDELNRAIEADAEPALARGERVEKTYAVRNVNRAVGATLAYRIVKKHGPKGLPEDTIAYTFEGAAGQSFGAFAAPGMTLVLEGEANDYLGKGLSGGKIIVRVPGGVSYDPAGNVIAGNTALYGATGGRVYINGLAGERFCVRNSGARVVVEGVGDHGCEYMTGGVVAVLGRTGVNFAAGMSGGIAYVYDPQQDFDLRCNLDMVDLERVVEPEDVAELRALLAEHHRLTGSARAKQLLDDWDKSRALFVKVFPIEYRRALGLLAEVEKGMRKTREEEVRQA